MSLSEKDAEFIARRRQLIGNWRYVGGVLVLLIGALGVYLWFRAPLLANPFFVIARIEAATIAETTLLLSAVMLPLVTLALIGMLGVCVLIIYRALAHERRLIVIIERVLRTTR